MGKFVTAAERAPLPIRLPPLAPSHEGKRILVTGVVDVSDERATIEAIATARAALGASTVRSTSPASSAMRTRWRSHAPTGSACSP